MGDIEYNKKVARENIKRYKEIISQNKLKKNKDFEAIDKLVQKVLNGVMQAVMNVHKDPAKYADVSWKLSILQQEVYDQRTYNSGNSYGHDGLLKVYDRYNENYIKAHADKTNNMHASSSDTYMDNMEYYGCDKDFAWGPYCILTGWVTGAIPLVFLDLLGLKTMY